jgi:hypothetical protein
VASFWRREAISWAVAIGVGLRLCELEVGVGDGIFILTVPGLSGHSQNRLLRVRPLQIGRALYQTLFSIYNSLCMRLWVIDDMHAGSFSRHDSRRLKERDLPQGEGSIPSHFLRRSRPV